MNRWKFCLGFVLYTCVHESYLRENSAFDCQPGLESDPQVFYHAHKTNKCKFIQCDQWGNAYEVTCGNGTKWNQKVLTCVHLSFDETCLTEDHGFDCAPGLNATPQVYYHPHKTDKCKFIQCDAFGSAHEQLCPKGTKWDQVILRCNHLAVGETCENAIAKASCCGNLQPVVSLLLIALGSFQLLHL